MKKVYHKLAGLKLFLFSVSKWASIPKLIDKSRNEIFPIETGTVESEIGTIKYVKKDKIVTYTIDFTTSSISAATSNLGKVPYYNPYMDFEGGGILIVANTPVGYASCGVSSDGMARVMHSAYNSNVQFRGSVTVILE